MLMAPIDKRVENPSDTWNNKRSSDYGGVNRNYARNDFQNRERGDRPRQFKPRRPSLADVE
jgi:hypothetical protein